MTTKIKKTSVGLIVLTELPGVGLVAVLQRRGPHDFEKMKPESWPGGCQVTCHGRMEEGEHEPVLALCREIGEELGWSLQEAVDRLTEISDIDTGRERVVTFAVFLEIDKIKTIRLHASTGGLVLLSQGSLGKVIDLTAMSKTGGVSEDFVAMFPDELEAVKTAFEKVDELRQPVDPPQSNEECQPCN